MDFCDIFQPMCQDGERKNYIYGPISFLWSLWLHYGRCNVKYEEPITHTGKVFWGEWV